MALEITGANFEQEVLSSDLPVLLDFWAPWCGPCKMVSPIINELADELKGVAKVGKVNVDMESGLAAKYGIMSIPTLMSFKDGKIHQTAVGARDKDSIKKLLD